MKYPDSYNVNNLLESAVGAANEARAILEDGIPSDIDEALMANSRAGSWIALSAAYSTIVQARNAC